MLTKAHLIWVCCLPLLFLLLLAQLIFCSAALLLLVLLAVVLPCWLVAGLLLLLRIAALKHQVVIICGARQSAAFSQAASQHNSGVSNKLLPGKKTTSRQGSSASVQPVRYSSYTAYSHTAMRSHAGHHALLYQ